MSKFKLSSFLKGGASFLAMIVMVMITMVITMMMIIMIKMTVPTLPGLPCRGRTCSQIRLLEESQNYKFLVMLYFL